MTRRPLGMLAAVFCSVALRATPAGAQAQPPAPATSASVPASTALPKTLPLRREEPAPHGMPSGLAAGAVLLVLLAGAGILLVRRASPHWLRQWAAGRAGPAAGVTRLASQSLTPHASVHVVRWSDEELLLGCTAQQVTVIARRPSPPMPGGGA